MRDFKDDLRENIYSLSIIRLLSTPLDTLSEDTEIFKLFGSNCKDERKVLTITDDPQIDR